MMEKRQRPPLKLDFHHITYLIKENQTLTAVEVTLCTVVSYLESKQPLIFPLSLFLDYFSSTASAPATLVTFSLNCFTASSGLRLPEAMLSTIL